MQESAIKGLEPKGSDAEIRKSSISRISVEGYDTSLRREDVDWSLREHLASCGNIIHVYVPRDVESGILCRYALVYVNAEDEEKALSLDGSDMGGRILQINPYPFHENHLDDDYLAPMKEVHIYRHQHTMMVTGCDTSLPIDVIKTQLKNYFSAGGCYVCKRVTSSGAIRIPARVHAWGQEGVEKALERSGRSVGGLNFVVTRVVPLPKNPPTIGYLRPQNFAIDKTETRAGNQKKKKSKFTERNQKKKKKIKTREGYQKKESETREGNQRMKGI